MNNYPLDSASDSLNNALVAVPKLPQKPEMPYEPVLSLRTDKPYSGNAKFGVAVFLVFIVSSLLSICYEFPLAYLMVFLTALFMAHGFKIVFVAPFSYLNNLEKFHESNRKEVRRYEALLTKYSKTDMPNYPSKVEEWERIVKEMESEEYIFNYRKQLIQSIFKKIGCAKKTFSCI